MSNSSRTRCASRLNRVASALDLHCALERAGDEDELASADAPPLPPQAPRFLKGLPKVGDVYEPQQRITKRLKAIIEKHYYAGNFEDAIEQVSKQRVPELKRIKTLDQYYFYIDAMVTWIPEIRVWDWDGELMHERTVYLRITQFYYYFNQAQLQVLQSPIAPLEGEKLSPLSSWMRDFAVEWGSFLDTPESSRFLDSFKYAPEYAWQDYEKEPQEYETFNHYFSRTFKHIDKRRPVAAKDDDRVIVFPAESTFVGQWAVSTPVGKPLPAPPSIVVKHIEWQIKELLADSEFADHFKGGIFCHSFLNTYDYHRQHAPVGGTVLEAKFIPGQVYLQVALEDDPKGHATAEDETSALAQAVIPRRYLDAADATGYQFVQCRGLMVLENPTIGKVAVLPMGMAQVSSVAFVKPGTDEPIVLTKEEKKELSYEDQVKKVNEMNHQEVVGKDVAKGDMISTFLFGGSDIVMVFERKSNVDITAKVGVHYPIRSQYAISNINR